ncbi:signal recognition particle subunit SRP68-like [Apostichopus japonicus]|uniref:signal recognition particle subunit SRP68-like n=1 Tax=Stichopus japonicus TaxID=307972 RepID=UPI003AB85E9F
MAQLGLKDNRPLAEWLDWYNANQLDLATKPNFTTFPLDFKPSPCKPLFFDIALNHIELPSLDEKLEQNKSSPQGGLGGFLRGWWSRGGEVTLDLPRCRKKDFGKKVFCIHKPVVFGRALTLLLHVL